MTAQDVKHTQVSPGFCVDRKKRLVANALGVALLSLCMLALLRNLFRQRCNSNTVLILEPFGMGDALTHEPLVRVLRDSGHAVVVCSRREWRSLIPLSEGVRWLDVSVPWAAASFSRKYRSIRGLVTSVFETARSIGAVGRGGIGIDTRGDVRSILLLHLAGCRKVYSLSHYIGSSMRIPPCGVRPVTQAINKLRWKLNLDFAAALGVTFDASRVAPPSVARLFSGMPQP